MGTVLNFQSHVEGLSEEQNSNILELARSFNDSAQLTIMDATDCHIINAGIHHSDGKIEYFFTINKQRTRSGVYQYIVSSPKTETQQLVAYNFSNVLDYLQRESRLANQLVNDSQNSKQTQHSTEPHLQLV